MRHALLAAALAALAAALAPAARAQWIPPNPCDRQPDKAGLELCLERELRAADARLNAAYQQAQGAIRADTTLPAPDRDAWLRALRDAQRAWMAFRDADCGDLTAREWAYGTGAGTASSACLLDKIARRTRELVERYNPR